MEAPGGGPARESGSGGLDRQPRRRPEGAARGYQLWRDLLFLHWPVPEAALRPLVPAGLGLALHQGSAYLSLVAFAIKDARPRWWPQRFALDFLETNLRTYVHVDGKDPGVYFFSLDAASRLAVRAARAGFGLPYFAARMRMERRDRRVDYRTERLSDRRAALRLSYEVGRPVGPALAETLDHFLVERYLLHVPRRGRLYTGQVHHRPYPLSAVKLLAVEDGIAAAQGLPPPPAPPPLVHYSFGVDVEVFSPRRRG